MYGTGRIFFISPHSQGELYNTIRCDMVRDAILTCVQKLTRVSLIYRTETITKKCKTEKKLKSKKTDMLRSIDKQPGESEEEKEGCGGKHLQKRKVLSLE